MKSAIARILRSLAERIEPTERVGHTVPLGWTGYLINNGTSGLCPNCGAAFTGTHVCSSAGTFTYRGPLDAATTW